MGSQNESILVIGAGVSGLTTAITLAESGSRVLVVAADPPRASTSAAAGAMWGPSFQEPMDKTLAWTAYSLSQFESLALDPDSGVHMTPVLTSGDLPEGSELPPQVRLIPELRPCTADELPAGFDAGFRAVMPLIEMPRYLDYLVARLERAEGSIELRTLASLDEAGLAVAVVVNCSGLGARELAGDRNLLPVFGQHVLLANPGLETAFIELSGKTEWTSYMPHRDVVVCGGIAIPGRWDATPDPELTDRILARCRLAEPRLIGAEVRGVATGLRPERPVVRVEAEAQRGTRIVHNYGHGSSGVSLSWGCAREAAALVLA